MKIPKDGKSDPSEQVGAKAPAANDDTIDGGGRPGGWDPFEVWRTRVRDARPRGADPSDPAPES